MFTPQKHRESRTTGKSIGLRIRQMWLSIPVPALNSCVNLGNLVTEAFYGSFLSSDAGLMEIMF